MAQTLRYGDQLFAGVPDNVSRLIQPENIRDYMASQFSGHGFIASEVSTALTMSDGVPLSINPLLADVLQVTDLWAVDGNNLLHPDYAGWATVPAGYKKSVQMEAVLSLFHATGGSPDYEIQFQVAGAPIGRPVLLTFDGSQPQTVSIVETLDLAISDLALVGLRITPVLTSDDLDLTSFQMTLTDHLLSTDPTP